jgi:hypothetical protein
MKQDNSISSLARSQGKLYLHSGGSMMLNIIIIMVIFASIISAVVYMSSSSLRQAVSSNQGANAWNMAEAGYRFLSINYMKTTDPTNLYGSVDAAKAHSLSDVNGRTYVIPQNGSFTLTVQPYWFYNAGARTTGRNISVQLPGTTPSGFTMPGTGEVKVGDTSGANIRNYTNGVFTSSTGIFTCSLANNTTLNRGDSVYLVLNPNATQNLTPGGNLTLNLANFPAGAFPAKDGLIEINPDLNTQLYRYSTATAAGSILTLYNLRHSDNSPFNPNPKNVTAASTVTFKKCLMAQSVGKVGNEQRTLSFSEAILDSFASTTEVHTLDTKKELQDNFNSSSSVGNNYDVKPLNISGGGSAIFSIINEIATTGTGASAYNCGAFWYRDTGLINSLWAPPPVGTGVYLLTYEVQVKAATGNALEAGAIGLAFRAKDIGKTSETYLALTFMRYDLPNLYFNRQAIGTAAIIPGYKVVGATSNATGIVQGTPEITSGSWAGGNATGKIRFASVTGGTGTFSADETLKVFDLNNVPVPVQFQVNGSNYFACSLPPCTANSTDFIPQTIKPKPSDFSPARYNIGPLLLVLWEKKSDGTLRWLAYKDITYDDYAKGYQDFVAPAGSCTSNCNGSDGLIVNDNASMYIRLQEKRVVLVTGSDAVKVNDINVFYGDSTSRYTTPARDGDTKPYNINEGRRLYAAGSPFTPIWAPEYINQWDRTVDYFSHIESGIPTGSFQWDAVNPSAVADITNGGGLLKICNDGSADCTYAPDGTLRLTELVTPNSGAYIYPEMGMLACGKVTQSPYSTAGFAEFSFKTPGTTSGGFVDTKLYW